ncbi:MAG: hypothetical protein PVJ86_13055 [Phycisphaerales bacterium]|jgi:hypothetical protein
MMWFKTYKRIALLASLGLILMIGLLGTVVVGAQGGGESSGEENVVAYVKDKDGNIKKTILATDPGVTDGRALGIRTPSDIEALFPKGDESSTVHTVPALPVVVDGVRYEPEEISRFNGQVLRFVADERTGREGVIYAFATVEGLEKYLKEQWDWPPSQESQESEKSEISNTSILIVEWPKFYQHWWYGGDRLEVKPGHGVEDLGIVGFDDEISSLKVGPDASWIVLYERQLCR